MDDIRSLILMKQCHTLLFVKYAKLYRIIVFGNLYFVLPQERLAGILQAFLNFLNREQISGLVSDILGSEFMSFMLCCFMCRSDHCQRYNKCI